MSTFKKRLAATLRRAANRIDGGWRPIYGDVSVRCGTLDHESLAEAVRRSRRDVA